MPVVCHQPLSSHHCCVCMSSQGIAGHRRETQFSCWRKKPCLAWICRRCSNLAIAMHGIISLQPASSQRVHAYSSYSHHGLVQVRRNQRIEIVPLSTGCLGACTYCKTKHARGELGSYSLQALDERVRQAAADPMVDYSSISANNRLHRVHPSSLGSRNNIAIGGLATDMVLSDDAHKMTGRVTAELSLHDGA